ncbi:MAG: hypothetical protein K2O74_03915 [Eubacteriales bacterium]|nr:hypothetical protein [Eubacteriales bacterium]
MNRNQAKIEEIIRQEEELCFDRFGSEDALRLGQILIGLAKEAGVCYVVNISLNRRQLFHFHLMGSRRTMTTGRAGRKTQFTIFSAALTV